MNTRRWRIVTSVIGALLAGTGVVILFTETRRASPDTVAVEAGEEVLKQFEHLSLSETQDCISRLGKAKRFRDLAIIYNSDVSGGFYAVTVHVRELDPDRAIALCSRFELASGNWIAAMRGLPSHRKADVLGYIRQVCTSTDPMVRAVCYWICLNSDWGDLVDYAQEDVDATYPLIGGLWQRPGETLGSFALQYCASFGNSEVAAASMERLNKYQSEGGPPQSTIRWTYRDRED